jgi:DNA-3-methyladenine glycosylase I
MSQPSAWHIHDHPIEKPKNDNEYFERMSRVIFMSGLNWQVLEKKWPGIKKAFNNFDIHKVAKFQESKMQELMGDPNVIRNLPKIKAIVANAQQMQAIAKEFGSFANYLTELRKSGSEDKLRETISKQFAFLGKGTTVIFLFAVGEQLPKAVKEWEDRHKDQK